MTKRIACWSGPRNVSTALMRSFDARGDCHVVDEPLYAAFLAATGLSHPGRQQIMDSQPHDPQRALGALDRPCPHPLQFEKHMAQHWLDEWPMASLAGAHHVFLVRNPAAVATSYARVRDQPVPNDLGLLQQEALLHFIVEHLGQAPVVIDGDRLRSDPGAVLRSLCRALDISWTKQMLRWAPGTRATDGVWAPHWYANVEGSTGFLSPTVRPLDVPPGLTSVVAALQPAYERLLALHLHIDGGV